jgi:hypothetical protein
VGRESLACASFRCAPKEAILLPIVIIP